ncbi:MAG TPA: chloride channel protein [Gemmataceae bacterium]|nr:chloride channel protein [Gemmataceae bacterium]
MSMQARATARQIGPLEFFVWSLLIGVVGAVGAVLFRGLIGLFHNVLFLGMWSFHYDANLHTPESPWGALVIFVPVLGAAGVAFLVRNFAPEAKGHGVPEVIDAIYYNKGVVRPIVALIKSLASALSIGSGGSVGREGPIVQIGSSFGSTLGQLLRVPVWQRITLIAAGAGAGIAATFNTPIGGVLFAVEIMLHEVSARTLVPVTIATVTASYIGRRFFGSDPSFIIPKFQIFYFRATNPYVLIFYLGLGLLTGLVSVLYIRSIYLAEDLFERRVGGSYYVRHMLGMLGVGVLMYALFRLTGHYHIQGVGYATVQEVLLGKASWFLLALFFLKLLATSLTLGSGASGGVFSPALYLGATLGGVYGLALHQLFPGLPIQPAAFAVAGMAGVVGGATGAALAAIVMIFEMTLDYNVIIPMTITVALSYGLRTLLHRQSIYTEKLVRRGHAIPDSLQANFYQLKKARDIMDTHFVGVPADGSIADFARIATGHPEVSCFLVEGSQGLVGFLTRDSALRPAGHPPEAPLTLSDLAQRKFVTIGMDMPLLDVMSRLRAAGASVALVTDSIAKAPGEGIRGLITKQQIATAVIDGMELFSA